MKNNPWFPTSFLIAAVVFFLTYNREWADLTQGFAFMGLWFIIAATYPWFLNLANLIRAHESGSVFPTLIGTYLITISLANFLLPALGVPTFPLLDWLPLPSYSAWVLGMALLPPVFCLGIAAYIIISNLIYSIRTKTLY